MSLQQTIYINDILHLHTVINNELWPRAPRENRKNMPRQLMQKTPASFLFCEKFFDVIFKSTGRKTAAHNCNRSLLLFKSDFSSGL